MSAIHELGRALRARRIEMGLSQAQVATLSGLSRRTVNQVEISAVRDLSLAKAERLASVLGLMLRIDKGSPSRKTRTRMAPLVRAAATASVSYKKRIAPMTLKRILAAGQMSERYIPYVASLLDDASVSLLAAVAEQLHDEANLSREGVWENYRSLARQLKSRRPIWGMSRLDLKRPMSATRHKSTTPPSTTGHIATDILGLYQDGKPDYKRVANITGLSKEDLSKISKVAKASVRFDEAIPPAVAARLRDIANLANLVAEFFDGDAHKVGLWFELPSPDLGNVSPLTMIRGDRFKRLLNSVLDARDAEHRIEDSPDN